MKIIKRDYLQELIDYKGTQDIKVITGIRRSGKSMLITSFKEYIMNSDEKANIIYIDFNNLEFEKLHEYHELNNYVISNYDESKNNYLIIDEVQMCKNFEKTINSLHSQNKYDIYITGSNAFLLSSNLATLFTGRTIELKVFPFSYKEYLEYFELNDAISNFNQFIEMGGFSGSYLYQTEKARKDYINSVYQTIIERDLIERKKIRNKNVLTKVTSFLMDNISNLTSIKNISDIINKNDMKVNDKTIGSYIGGLCQAFLFYKVNRYDIKGKKYLSSSEKYYLCDVSLKTSVLGIKDMNYGRMYENIVAIELLRRGYEVYVGVLYKSEIDFVCMKRDEKIYIQVSDNIENESTFNREVSSLLKIKDAYPKILIARTKHPEYLYEGIRIIDIGEWLVK